MRRSAIQVSAGPIGRPVLQLLCGLLLAACAASVLAASAEATPSLESYSLSVAGQSQGGSGGCSTFGPTPQVAAFFNGGAARIPSGGLQTCGVAGDSSYTVSVTGPISTTFPLNTAWSTNTYNGIANSQVAYGALAATSQSVLTGSNSSTTVVGSESFGKISDGFTITSPSVANGQAGTVKFTVTVTGGVSTANNGTADVELNCQFGAGPVYTMFRSQATSVFSVPFITSIGGGLGGFTGVPGSMSGTGTPSTFAQPIVFGTSFDFRLGLLAYAIPGGGPVCSQDSHFQAYISGITVTGPLGQVLTDVAVVSASGTPYGLGGVTAVDGAPKASGEGDVRFAAVPNPVAAGTRLSFSLPPQASAHLEIYDSAGRLVRKLREFAAGHAPDEGAWWDGRTDRGVALPSGAYYARLRWSGGSRTVRVVISR